MLLERERTYQMSSIGLTHETPVFSNAQKETTKAVTHDWQVQELAVTPRITMLMRG